MDKISRQEAIDRGLTRYFTGLECKRGHVAERYTLQGQCSECQKLGTKKYQDGVKERLEAARMRNRIGRGAE